MQPDAGGRSAVEELDASRPRRGASSFDPKELSGLPKPVQRYFAAVLGQTWSIVAGARLEQSGTFNLGQHGDRWKRFTATQRVITRPPGFDWDARIMIGCGLSVRVHDAYVERSGILHASLFGFVPLVSLRGTPELAEGELMRFLAEAAWYPTALLPGQGVQWTAVDERSARATLADGSNVTSLLFMFGANGLIESVRAEARGRTVAGRVTPTPWEGTWSGYESQSGMVVPMAGEAAWLLPEGRKPYWRARVTRITYDAHLR